MRTRCKQRGSAQLGSNLPALQLVAQCSQRTSSLLLSLCLLSHILLLLPMPAGGAAAAGIRGLAAPHGVLAQPVAAGAAVAAELADRVEGAALQQGGAKHEMRGCLGGHRTQAQQRRRWQQQQRQWRRRLLCPHLLAEALLLAAQIDCQGVAVLGANSVALQQSGMAGIRSRQVQAER